MAKRRSGAAASGQGDVLRAMQAAVAAHRQGRLSAAIESYRRVLRLKPDLLQAHNNLGVALKAAGRLDEAAASYRRAIALDAGYAAAHANLGAVLAQQGDPRQSLVHALRAWRVEPTNGGYRQGLAEALRPLRFKEASPKIGEALLACFADPGIEHQPLVPAALSYLRLESSVSGALAAVEEGESLATETIEGLIGHPMLLVLLRQSVIADPAFERLFTRVRRAYLEVACGKRDGEVDGGFGAALAIQCFLTDFVYAESAEESADVTALGETLARLEGPEASVQERLLTLALYRPLATFPWIADLRNRLAPVSAALAEVLRVQHDEPLAEAALAETLPSLTPISDATSKAVRAQYEAHPYPRWLTARRREARPLGQVVRSLFPALPAMPLPDGPTRILVAGCGTGKHAVDVASRYADAKVLAVDLSRRSLGFAQRQAQARRLSNLAFAQADLTRLGGLEQRFHLIEAMGVLHHLADPVAGWRVLADLLEPSGLMRLGLYSRLGRRHVAAARRLIAERGFPDTAAGIRAARAALRALEAAAAARGVVGELDFYNLAGCHDLLFNVQETSFELPEIAAALETLGLAFLGFEFHEPSVPAAYRAWNPDDRAMTDLAAWARFEAAEPDSFSRMYQFWCRRI